MSPNFFSPLNQTRPEDAIAPGGRMARRRQGRGRLDIFLRVALPGSPRFVLRFLFYAFSAPFARISCYFQRRTLVAIAAGGGCY